MKFFYYEVLKDVSFLFCRFFFYFLGQTLIFKFQKRKANNFSVVIHCAASVLSGLSRYHEEATIEVVDNILEDIRSGMEFPDPRFNLFLFFNDRLIYA